MLFGLNKSALDIGEAEAERRGQTIITKQNYDQVRCQSGEESIFKQTALPMIEQNQIAALAQKINK